MTKKSIPLALAAVVTTFFGGAHQAMAGQVVLELFTSQGCSSCPPADELMQSLSSDHSLVILSFHVDYWDNLGWKDPYASANNTNRQRGYASAMSLNSVFTPQLVVNGEQSLVGSRNGDVRKAIVAAKDASLPVKASLSPDVSGNILLTVSGVGYETADIWEARFVHHAATPVRSGENGGRTLESVNNVTSLQKLNISGGKAVLAPLQSPEDGIAVIVQNAGQGKIIGNAIYMEN